MWGYNVPMSEPITIIKSTGEKEPFDPVKLSSSLTKAGASGEVIRDIIKHIEDKSVHIKNNFYLSIVNQTVVSSHK